MDMDTLAWQADWDAAALGKSKKERERETIVAPRPLLLL